MQYVNRNVSDTYSHSFIRGEHMYKYNVTFATFLDRYKHDDNSKLALYDDYIHNVYLDFSNSMSFSEFVSILYQIKQHNMDIEDSVKLIVDYTQDHKLCKSIAQIIKCISIFSATFVCIYVYIDN